MTNEQYGQAARNKIKAAAAELGLGMGDLYQALYGEKGSPNQVQALRNRLGRGNTSADFIGLCVEKLEPLQSMTMAEFYGAPSKED